MKFPDELTEVVETAAGREWKFPTAQLRELATSAGDTAAGLSEKVDSAAASALANGQDPHYAVVDLIEQASLESPAFRALLGEILTPRHPSQLYEAMVEGLIPFLLLLAIRLKWKNAWHGILTGIFFVFYAVGRIAVENFREPDAENIAGMTRGQFYSLFMIVVGIAFLAYGVVKKRKNRLPA
jgi:phosphatidylglycerol:prolipoprotein diacylglycerol transferase